MFPKDREAYILKLLSQIVLAVFIVWIIFFKSEKDSIYVIVLSSMVGIVLLIVLYEKIVFFLKVDKITASDDSLHLSFKNHSLQTYPFKKIGLKIVSDIGGASEVSFYDLSENKKIFSCKENEVDKNDLHSLLLYLQKTTDIDTDIIKNGTYGEVVPLVTDFDEKSHVDSLARYYDKYYFYKLSGYGWLIYPFVIIVVFATLYFIN